VSAKKQIIKVLVADDHPVVRKGLQSWREAAPDQPNHDLTVEIGPGRPSQNLPEPQEPGH